MGVLRSATAEQRFPHLRLGDTIPAQRQPEAPQELLGKLVQTLLRAWSAGRSHRVAAWSGTRVPNPGKAVRSTTSLSKHCESGKRSGIALGGGGGPALEVGVVLCLGETCCCAILEGAKVLSCMWYRSWCLLIQQSVPL